MDELERRLRDTLRARAEDVEATPDLWLEIRERRERKQHLRWLTLAGMAAAAAVVAVVAVPAAFDALRTGGDLVVGPGPAVTTTPSPTPAPTTPPAVPGDATPSITPTGDPALPAVPPGGVATDGSSIFRFTPDGSVGETLYTFPAEGGSTVQAIAVRPGSTADDLTAVLLTEAEGMYDLRWLAWDGRDAEVRAFPEQHNLRNHAVTGSVPAPVWSPDGRHVMWIEDGDDGEPGLRAIGWSDGPGTGPSADDNVELGMPVLPQGTSARAQDWVWTDGTGDQTRGYLTVTSADPGALTAWRIGLERQGDGALALSSTMGSEPFGEAVVDQADSHVSPGTDAGPSYLLSIGDAGEGDLGLELTWSSTEGDGGQLPLPDGLSRGSDTSSVWMTGRHGGVVVGTGGDAWLVTFSGDVRNLDGDVRYAVLVP